MDHAASVALLFGGEVLLVHRNDGTWCFPGGRGEVGESPLQTARREFAEEVEADAYNFHPYRTPLLPVAEIIGQTPKGQPHHLVVFVLQAPPTIQGVQEEELQGWDWVKPSAAGEGRTLHHGVEGDLRQMMDDPRLYTT
jgi:8-oxo-dGTP diphosphatase